MKFIELFAGIGGFRYGLESVNRAPDRSGQGHKKENDEAGQGLESAPGQRTRSKERQPNEQSDGDANGRTFTCVYANEIDKYACQIYRRNYGDKELYEGDITKVEARAIPDHDLLCAGFPCQAFSIAGKRRGFRETRGTLFFEITRIVREKQPRLLLLENVKGLLSHDKGATFATILSTLDEIGYDCQWEVLNSKNFGVPQNRERVFIVGHLRGTSRPKVFPIGESTKIYKKPDRAKQGKKKCASTVRPGLSGLPGNSETYIVHNVYGGFKEKKVREFKNISPTIRTPKGGGHIPDLVTNGQIRKLTSTECCRLQGFTDNWVDDISDSQKYKCLGNAVTTNVIRAIGERLV